MPEALGICGRGVDGAAQIKYAVTVAWLSPHINNKNNHSVMTGTSFAARAMLDGRRRSWRSLIAKKLSPPATAAANPHFQPLVS